MSLYTDVLKLFKKDPETDGATNFNIVTMLNDNWDKIEAEAVSARAKIWAAVADLASAKEINGNTVPDNALMLIKSLGLYRFDSTSTADGDDNTIITPTIGNGRWIALGGKAQPVGAIVGTSDTQTLTNKTLLQTKIDQIKDTVNGLVALVISGVVSAVNHLTVSNASTGNAPTISATGNDANVSINLVPKGAGTVQVKGSNIALYDDLATHLSDYVRQPGYGVTAGSANTYTLTLSPAPTVYTDGMGIVVKINAANTGASTINVNSLGAKAIVDSKGTALISGKLKLNGTYSLKYNSTLGNFILQGEGGDYGTAGAAQVLTGYTVGTDAGIVTGTIPNRPGDTAGTLVSTAITGRVKILPSEGYHDGVDDCVYIDDADFIAGNIKNGVNIFGLAGTLDPKLFAYGSLYANAGSFSVSGLAFTPSFIFVTIQADMYAFHSLYVSDDFRALVDNRMNNGCQYCINPQYTGSYMSPALLASGNSFSGKFNGATGSSQSLRWWACKF